MKNVIEVPPVDNGVVTNLNGGVFFLEFFPLYIHVNHSGSVEVEDERLGMIVTREYDEQASILKSKIECVELKYDDGLQHYWVHIDTALTTSSIPVPSKQEGADIHKQILNWLIS